MIEDAQGISRDPTTAFQSANNARRRGDFTSADSILCELLESLRVSTDPERDALIAIAESKREFLVATAEMAKRRAERSLGAIARAYYRSARKSRIPVGSTSRQQHRIVAYRNLALANARKWRGVQALQVQASAVVETLSSLQAAERHYRKAVMYASAAARNPSADVSPRVEQMLLFTHCTVLERMAFLEYMISGNEEAFQRAEAAWKDALKAAYYLCADGEAPLFPNRFYCLKDLELEGTFLQAGKAFRERDYARSAQLLQEWVDDFPESFRWSWREANVRIRLQAALTLQALLSGNGTRSDSVRAHLRDLNRLSSSEPVGRVARYLAHEISALLPKIADLAMREATLQALPAFFPLDSTVEYYDLPSELDPLDSLPQRIRRGFCIPRPESRLALERAKVEFLASVEALLGHICDYDQQWSFPSEQLLEPSVINYLAMCRRFRWYSFRGGDRLVERLELAIRDVKAAETIEGFEVSYAGARNAVGKLLRFSPLIVTMELPLKVTVSDGYADAIPDWSLNRAERDLLQIAIASADDAPIPAGRYYLPPAWRLGNRMSYIVNRADKRPLWPVRFEPRWAYWEEELDAMGPTRVTGLPMRFLERAVELASLCVSEDRTTRPKVGALIVRDGIVLAEAYRNEDGRGSHAEQIAFAKSGKQDLSGATLITTLEPCTGGRSNHTPACGELVVLKGITRVVIGTLDPNPAIRGTAEFLLRKNGIVVEHFPNDFATRVYENDREHIDYYMKRKFREVYVYR